MKKIFIAGIPGTGKTTIGNHLRDVKGFRHIDFEEELVQEFANDPETFVHEQTELDQDLVITWGFVPDSFAVRLVDVLRQNGFKIIWFDGNREAALREFNKRGDVEEPLFHQQVGRIDTLGVISALDAVHVNTFSLEGRFRPLNEIVEEIL